MKSNNWLQGFLRGVRPAAVGAILVLSVTLGQSALVDAWTIIIPATTILLLAKFRAPIPLIIVGCEVAGAAARTLQGTL